MSQQADGQFTHPYKDGDVLVIGPGVIYSPEDEVISFNGRNYSAPPPMPLWAAEEPQVDQHQKYLRREAMDWSVRLGTTDDDNDKITSRAQALYDWLIEK